MSTDFSETTIAEPVGEQLRQARLDQKHTLEEAASHTRISLANLRAIEDSSFEQLPADAFTKGLVALYAAYLDLDGQNLAAQFLQERGNGKSKFLTPLQQRQVSHSLEPKKLAEQARVSSAVAAMVLLICIIFSFTGFCLYYSWNPFAYLTDKALSLTTTVKNTFHPADPATSGLRSQNVLALQAVFYADCRVRVIIDNQPAIEQTYLKGSTIQWEAARSMQLDFFQENCADFQFNGSLLNAPVFRDGQATLRLPLPVHGP
ncbi:MAG: helix-turn-helix domain-containing protein [Desulfobulbus sp.]